MNSARVAELLRAQARLHGELARNATALADELAGEASPAPAPANDTKGPPYKLTAPASALDMTNATRELERRRKRVGRVRRP